MPGAVPITSTYALTNATLPYILAVADHGIVEASRRDPGLKLGINVAKGKVTHRAVADGVGSDYDSPEEVLGISDANGSGPSGADGAGATASRAQPGAH
jgi:alanine dehydrogenase